MLSVCHSSLLGIHVQVVTLLSHAKYLYHIVLAN